MERLIEWFRSERDQMREFADKAKGLTRDDVMHRDNGNVPMLLLTFILMIGCVVILGINIIKLF